MLNGFQLLVKRHHKFDQGRNQEFFSAGEVSWNKNNSINISSTIQERKVPLRKISEYFLLLNRILNEKYNLSMNTIEAFFFQNQDTFFEFSKNGRKNSHPSTPQIALMLIITDIIIIKIRSEVRLA